MLEFSTYIENRGSPPHAQLHVRIHMFGGWGVGPKGEMLITPPLLMDYEVDHHINQIIAGLERVRLEAKAKLEENR